MIPESVKEIISLLVNKSEAGQVNWVDAETAGVPSLGFEFEDDYYVVLPDSTMNVYRQSSAYDIFFQILDSGGRPIVEIASSDDPNAHALLERLIQSAKHKTLNIDSKLAGIKKALSGDSAIGRTKDKS